MHSSGVMMYWTPWRIPQCTHPYSHTHGEDNSCTVSQKTTAVCNWGDKEKGGRLSPAAEHSLWSTEEDESKRKACLTEAVCLAGLLDNPQRETGDWSEEEKTSTGTAPRQEEPSALQSNLLQNRLVQIYRHSKDERSFYVITASVQ